MPHELLAREVVLRIISAAEWAKFTMRVGQAQSGPTSADEHHVADEHHREHDQPDLNPLGAEDLAMLTLPSD